MDIKNKIEIINVMKETLLAYLLLDLTIIILPHQIGGKKKPKLK
jgi:hypothetical protein